MTYNFKNKQEQERIYQYWNHNQTGEPICFVIDKFFKDVEEFTFVELGHLVEGGFKKNPPNTQRYFKRHEEKAEHYANFVIDSFNITNKIFNFV